MSDTGRFEKLTNDFWLSIEVYSKIDDAKILFHHCSSRNYDFITLLKASRESENHFYLLRVLRDCVGISCGRISMNTSHTSFKVFSYSI